MADKVEYGQWDEEYCVSFLCPGCGRYHTPVVTGPKAWQWNASTESPTLTPSILARGAVPITDEEHAIIMSGGHVDAKPLICHSYVTDGRIQFLSDSTHHLAGQTVELPDLD